MSTMLTHYDAAMRALSTALNSKDVTVVLKSRDDLDLMRLRAKQVKDRQLLADATEFQMRVERWLGVLLVEAKASGEIAQGRSMKGALDRVTLKDIGIDPKLSSSAQKAAAMKDDAFEARVLDARTAMTLGRKTASRSKRGTAPATQEPEFLLSDGTPIGQAKLGKLRSRIERLRAEATLLDEILARVGSEADKMTTVSQVISSVALQEMVGRLVVPPRT